MAEDSIVISEVDFERLLRLIERENARFDTNFVDLLDQKLADAHVVHSRDVPPNVVTMNSRVRYDHSNAPSGKEVAIVYPLQASPEDGLVSVLSPIGISLLGRKEGDISDVGPASSAARVRVAKITYQPEAAGHWYL